MTDTLRRGITEILTGELQLPVPAEDADLLATGTLDSLGLVELLFQLEQRFAVRVEMEKLDVEDFRTVRRIATFVERLQRGAPA